MKNRIAGTVIHFMKMYFEEEDNDERIKEEISDVSN